MKSLNIFTCTVLICFVAACRPLVTTSLEADLFEKTLNQTTNPQLIDVRTFKEYSEGHLPEAILMDIKETTFDKMIESLDMTRPVFVYCRSGKRSMEAASIFEKKKFKVVYNLDGGIIAWKAKGKVVSTPD